MTKRFRPEDIQRMMEHLRAMGAPFGITFADRPLLSNSRLALQAAEFAREHDRFGPFHSAVFAAYFSHGLDIGNVDVLETIALDAGLDAGEMKQSLHSGKYLPGLEKTKEEAAVRGVSGVPAFFIRDKKSVVGAQPLDVFRKALRNAGKSI
jgi:predicted DsbA family dithiol-disulfide isomerase